MKTITDRNVELLKGQSKKQAEILSLAELWVIENNASQILAVVEELSRVRSSGPEITIGDTKYFYGVFGGGAGQSGQAITDFLQRLIQLGFFSWKCGDSLMLKVSGRPIVVVLSNSGGTIATVNDAKVAKKGGALVIAITSDPKSPIGEMSDLIIVLPKRKMYEESLRISKEEMECLFPLGSFPEALARYVFNVVITQLMTQLGLSERDLEKRHPDY